MYKMEQVADDMRSRIGVDWLEGDSVGSVMALAKHYDVAHGTVRRAEKILVEESLLSEPRAGVPTRVIRVPSRSDNPILAQLRKLRGELDKIIVEMEGAA
jgi:DNA-binding GntR family transcriptional regulator